MRKYMCVILLNAQIMLADYVSSPFKNGKKRNSNVKVFPERNVRLFGCDNLHLNGALSFSDHFYKHFFSITHARER